MPEKSFDLQDYGAYQQKHSLWNIHQQESSLQSSFTAAKDYWGSGNSLVLLRLDADIVLNSLVLFFRKLELDALGAIAIATTYVYMLL